MEREKGYYWVYLFSPKNFPYEGWNIARWDGSSFVYDGQPYHENCFSQIDERRIMRAGETSIGYENTDMKKAYLFSFSFWENSPNRYLLVYAETEEKARDIGCKHCEFNSGQRAHAKDLQLCTYGLDPEPESSPTK